MSRDCRIRHGSPPYRNRGSRFNLFVGVKICRDCSLVKFQMMRGTVYCRAVEDGSFPSRRFAMKHFACVLVLLLAAVPSFAQQAPAPEIKYRSVPDFLKLPQDLYFGEVSGVAVNSKGHIFVFSRGNTTG